MGIFDFLKRKPVEVKKASDKPYWLLSTNKEKIREPNWQQIVTAIDNALPEKSLFVSLGFIDSDIEIEIIQAIGDGTLYRVEALPPAHSSEYGKIYYKEPVSNEEVLSYFKELYQNQTIMGLKDWTKGKI